MTKLRVSLGSASEGCAKPGCWHRAPLNRHHTAHEALWLGAWAHRILEPEWRRFVARYHEFHEEDTVLICLPHHAEIHSIYDEIIADDKAKTGLPLYLYSWNQGRILMRRLRKACSVWIHLETPGIDSDIYEQTKKVRRSLLKKRAQRRYPKHDGETKARRSKKLRNKRRKRRS